MTATALDPYVTLGIPSTASQAEAGRAHRALAKRYHPDVNPGPEAAERMRRINQAWRILSNPARRARYDATRTTAAAGPVPWHGSASGYGSRGSSATWAPWPNERTAAPRMRRPVRAEAPPPSFGDRPIVFVAVWAVLGILYFVGTWLGSLAP